MSLSTKFFLTQYAITECRYVNRRHLGLSTTDDSIKVVMDEFVQWVNGVAKISETKLPGTAIYVKEVASDKDAYVVVLWSATSGGNQAFALKESDPPGEDASVDQRKFKHGYIPGTPMYYFVDAARRRYYVMRPKDSVVQSRFCLEEVIEAFMLYKGKELGRQITVQKSDDQQLKFDNILEESLDAFDKPRFSGQLSYVDSVQTDLLNHAEDVRKIVHSVRLTDSSISNARSRIRCLMKCLNADIPDSSFEDSNYLRYEVGIKLERESLEKLMQKQDAMGATERMGFVLKGSNNILWSDHEIVRHEASLKVKSVSGVFSAKDLLNAVLSKKSLIG